MTTQSLASEVGFYFQSTKKRNPACLKRMKRPDFLFHLDFKNFTSGFPATNFPPSEAPDMRMHCTRTGNIAFPRWCICICIFVFVFFVFIAPDMRMHFTRTGNIAFPRESCRHNLTSDNCTRKRNVTLSPRLTLTPVQFFFSISLLHQSQQSQAWKLKKKLKSQAWN